MNDRQQVLTRTGDLEFSIPDEWLGDTHPSLASLFEVGEYDQATEEVWRRIKQGDLLLVAQVLPKEGDLVIMRQAGFNGIMVWHRPLPQTATVACRQPQPKDSPWRPVEFHLGIGAKHWGTVLHVEPGAALNADPEGDQAAIEAETIRRADFYRAVESGRFVPNWGAIGSIYDWATTSERSNLSMKS